MTTPTPESLTTEITRASHRRVLFVPGTITAERLGNMLQLERFVRDHNVSIRGWDFPHLGSQEGEFGYGVDHIWSLVDFGELREYWKFYKDGRFDGLYAERAEDEEYQKSLTWKARGARYSVSTVDVVYTLCEYVEFARRVMIRGRMTEGLTLTIKYHNMFNVGLGSEIDRVLSPYYICRDTEWDQEASLNLNSDFRAVSRWLASKFFERFGLELKPDTLQGIQDEFFGLRIGRDGSSETRWTPTPL